ncbi:sulfur carrier protein ThiS [Terriglobus aquaticus]|uniref:Sulfur carrier protein ThiS n=1 Tax=Terriglobus aquaticus TaxID=940139 RepID=A0ABW9KJU6_9BACT|nr:sulfur carrier protein ThiS [Terriglobus aquaticus]
MLVSELGFRPDRVALEQNGSIVPRTRWAEAPVREGDRLEVVHFVGGGLPG